MVASIVAGVALVIGGFWVMWARRPSDEDAGGSHTTNVGSAGGPARRGRLSVPTRLTIGLAMLIGGYHIAAYGSPDAWFPIKVPREKWWVLAIGAVVVVGGSLGIDQLEKRSA